MSYIRNLLPTLISNHRVLGLTNYGQYRNVKRWVGPTLRELRRRRQKMGVEALTHRSSHVEWNYNAEVFAFGNRLQENFDKEKLRQAFVNRSYITSEELKQREVGIENPTIDLLDNGSLSKRGEALINDYVRGFLQHSLPRVPANGIDAIFKFLTSEEQLAHLATNIGIKDLALCSDFPVESRTLADTFKAVIGALAESSGEQKAYKFIRDFICTHLNQRDLMEIWTIENPLEVLKESLRELKQTEPEPRLIGEVGKNTILAAYQVGIYVDKKLLGKGFGESVEIAIDQAAVDCLRRIYGLAENMRPMNFGVELTESKETREVKQII